VFDGVPFSRQFLAHGDARRVKSDPAFIALREEVLALIHHRELAAGSSAAAAAAGETAHG
jgi:taurine transport system ATP-binding protein